MNLNLPINAFDIILLAVLIVGVIQGRKAGMSQELMNLVKWLTIVVVGAVVYIPVGQWLAQSSPFSLLFSFMAVYTAVALLILALFAACKHYLGGKLLGSDIFGQSEYYLGMGGGLLRAACILLAVLALLNARYFSREEVLAKQRFQDEVYGKNYFPGWHSIQAMVFQESLTGPWIKDHLAFFLIEPTAPQDKSFHQKEADLPNWGGVAHAPKL
jgi:uncharacterized membrane protein required for colicin V production